MGGRSRGKRRMWWILAAMAIAVVLVNRIGAGWPVTRALLNRTLLQPKGYELVGGRVRWALVPRVRIDGSDLLLRGPGLEVVLPRVHAELSGFELLAGRLGVSDLRASRIEVSLAEGEGEGGTPVVPDPRLVRMALERFRFDRIVLADLCASIGDATTLDLALLRGALTGRDEGPTLVIDTLAATLGLSEPLALRAAGTEIVARTDRYSASRLGAWIGESRIEGTGSLRPGEAGPIWEARLHLDEFSLQSIRPLIDETITRAESRVNGRLQVRGEADTIHFAGRGRGHVDPIVFDADTVSGWWDGREIVVSRMEGVVEGIEIVATEAAIDPRTQDYRLKGRASGVAIEPYLDFMAGTELNGPVELRGSHFGGEELWLDVRAPKLRGRVFDLEMPDGALHLRYALGRYDFDGLRVGLEGARVDATGMVDPDEDSMRWEGHLSLDPDAAFFERFVPVEGLRGALEGDGRLSGPLETPRLTATYGGRSMEYGAFVLDSFEGEVDLDSVFHHPSGRAAIRGQGLLGVLPIRIDESELEVDARDLYLDRLLMRQDRRDIRATGPLRIDEGISGELIELALDSPMGGAVALDTVLFRADSSGFRLDPVAFHLGGGNLSLEGFWRVAEGLDIDFSVEEIDLTRLARLGGAGHDAVSGSLRASGRLEGTFENPKVEGEWSIGELSIGSAYLGSVEAKAGLDNGRVRFDRLRAGHGGSAIRISGEYPLGPQIGWNPAPGPLDEIDLSVELREWSLAELGALVGLDSLAGRVDASARLSGTLTSPTLSLSCDAVEPAVLGDRYADLTIEAEFDAGKLNLAARDRAGSQALGTLPFVFCLAPLSFAPSDEALDVELSLRDFDAAFLRHLVPDIESASGALRFDGHLDGHLPWPDAHGELSVDGGRVRLIWMNAPLHSISGSARVDGPRTILDRAEGKMGRTGRFTVSGSLTTRDYVPIDYDLGVKGKRLPIDWIPDLRAEVDADLRFTRNVHISGDVSVHEAIYSRAFGEEPEPIPPPALPGEELPFVLSYDLALVGDRNLWLRNSEADMELRGRLHLESLLDYDELPFTIQGELEVIRGTYTLLGKNRFEIESGRIEMPDPSILDPEMQVEAGAVLRERVRDEQGGYRSESLPVHLSLEGKFFSDLTYQFTDLSQGRAPIPIEDMILLLTFGRRRAAVDQGGLYDQTSAAADASAITAQLLESRVREFLDISLDISTGRSSPLESLDETYVGLGKYLNDKLFVYYSQYLSADPRRKLGVEYAFIDHVLVAGELDETDPNAPRYNVDLRYRLEY